MRVTADTDLCFGAGQCLLNAPEVFDQDEDGTVVLLQSDPPAELRDAIRRAVARCPSGAIQLHEG